MTRPTYAGSHPVAMQKVMQTKPIIISVKKLERPRFAIRIGKRQIMQRTIEHIIPPIKGVVSKKDAKALGKVSKGIVVFVIFLYSI